MNVLMSSHQHRPIANGFYLHSMMVQIGSENGNYRKDMGSMQFLKHGDIVFSDMPEFGV